MEVVMGDRAQIGIHDRTVKINDFEEEIYVYLYTHWHGYKLLGVLKAALERGKDRWSDGEYLARIIFSEMVKDDIDGTTGYGVGTTIHGDIFRPVPKLHPDQQKITWEYPNDITDRYPDMTFDEFLAFNFDNNEDEE
jgi:hypothetical protein